MTLLDELNDIPPRPEEEAAEAEADYRLTQLANPAEFMVVFAGGDAETLRCDEGVITGWERWTHRIDPTIRHELERELRASCA